MFFKNERKKCTENIFKMHSNISDKYLNIFNIFCRQTNKGSWKIGYSWMMWFLFLLSNFPNGLGLVHNRRVLQGASWIGQDFHTYPHPGKMPVVARDVMVNVVNSLGLKLLAIHNEDNDDNIAISPYGALSILIALGEGLQGDAVQELQKAAHIPNDISLIRIGLRDIHRHLKSYFIPPEGFLAGLTLNHENVTLKSKYEDILQFYGFDIMSFNNALYPSPPTTQYPIGSTTDKITKATIPMETTTLQQTTTESFTTSATESTTLTPISTTTLLPHTIPIAVTTEFPMNDFSAKVPETTTTSSTTIQDILSTTETPVFTTESISTTESNMETTEEITSEESISTEVPTTILSTTTSSIPDTTPFTTEDIVTTEEITTKEPTTTDIVTMTTETTTNVPTTEAIATTNPMETTEIIAPETDTAEATTTEVKPTESSVTEVITEEVKPTESRVTEATTTEESAQSIETTVSEISTTQTESSETTTVEATASEAVSTEAVTSDSTTTEETLPESTSTDSEIETTTILSFPYPDASTPETEVITENKVVTDETENIVKRKTRSKVELIKLNSPIEKTEVAKPLSLSSSRNRRRRSKRAFGESNKRKARSVIDYMIAKYYDNYQYRPLHNNQGIPYVPQTKPSFLVQGKYREYQVQFMKYDTVLPFFYVSYLNALALSFPLDSPQYYLLLLLPVQEDGVNQLICELRLNGSFKYIIDNLRYRHVTAVIPSFLLKGYVNLTPTFQKLGIRRVFEPRQADFSPMTNLKGIYITNIEQAITVNIKNYMDPAAFGESRQFHQEAPIEFRADHPFVYFVVDAEFHVVLMTGKVVNPLNTRIT